MGATDGKGALYVRPLLFGSGAILGVARPRNYVPCIRLSCRPLLQEELLHFSEGV